MDKLGSTSENIENMNLAKLRQVFPQFVKDGQIDLDSLKAYFEKDGLLPENDEKYGLGWAGKSNAFKLIKTPATGSLVPDEKESVDFDTTENIFIEGDNLEVLKLLQKHYREKIKMIYIDPPYNTGKDFIYKDNFKENVSDYYERTGQSEDGIKLTTNPESAGRYHSDWLTMMYPRLFLARNLLKEDGVIFISIDDNEVANLRLITDEIFGEENFIGEMTIIRAEGGGLAKQLIKGHDYLLIYSKSVASFEPLKKPKDIRGKIVEIEGIKYWLEDDWLRIEFGKYGTCQYKDIEKYKGIEKKIEIDKGIKNGIYHLINKNGKTLVARLRNVEEDGTKFYSISKHLSAQGVRDLNELKMNDYFDFPKPISLLKELIGGTTFKSKGDGDIILDFFAGSGTTAHAVMDLNAEDGGDRKWICVQLPEETDEKSEAKKAGYGNIAQISRERIRRAGNKIAKGDIGFKAYVLKGSNYRQWNAITDKDDTKKLMEQQKLFIEKPLQDRFDEKSVVYEILLKEGLDLNSNVTSEKTKIQTWTAIDKDRKIVVSFADRITSEQVDALKLSETDLFVCFDSALDDSTKANITRRKFNVKVI